MVEELWQNLRVALWNSVWAANLAALPPFRARLVRSMRLVHTIFREFGDGNLNLRAMSLVYATLLALVPLLAVSFSLLKAMGVHNQLEYALHNFLAPLGEKGVELGTRLVQFVDNVKVGPLGAIGLVLLLYTAVSLVYKVEAAFNYIWRVDRARSLGQRLLDYTGVLVVAPLLMFTAFGISAAVVGSETVQVVLTVEPFGALFRFASKFIPYMLVVAAFTFAYVYIPNTRVRLGPAFVGALVGGLLWALASWGFGHFVASSTRYTAIYSSFAILILFLIWMYVAWLILLVGATVGFYQQRPEYLGLLSHEFTVSNRLRERIALRAGTLVAGAYLRGEPPYTGAALATRLNVPLLPLETVLGSLETARILARTGDEPARYLPGRALEAIRIDALLEAVRTADEGAHLTADKVAEVPASGAVETALERAMADALGDMTLRELVSKEEEAAGHPADNVVPVPLQDVAGGGQGRRGEPGPPRP